MPTSKKRKREEGSKTDAKFADMRERFPFTWPGGIRPGTKMACIHCWRKFRFIEAKVDVDGLLMCPGAPECSGSALDFVPAGIVEK